MNEKITKKRWKTEAFNVEPTSEEIFLSRKLGNKAFYKDKMSLVFNMDANHAAILLSESGLKVDCIVTSPPFYGQRDYEVEGQIGLENNPQDYIDKLVNIFNSFIPILKPTGSLWVNIGDTYWSGRGQSRGKDIKQPHRRFGVRPQDKRRPGPWTRPKQLLLIPHRFAIAMQENEWIVRNDNVWIKSNPTPDPVLDRCCISHEYVFHFVRQRFYYFEKMNIGFSNQEGKVISPNDTWMLPSSRGSNGHKAAFSEELVSIPIEATCPPGGVVLDPFAGSGTTLKYAIGQGRRVIGVDIKQEYCKIISENIYSHT